MKKPDGTKEFSEDKPDPSAFSNLIMNELKGNKELMKAGEGDSSGGSDSAPSDDNLDATELIKNLPEADKTLKKKIKQEKEKKIEEEKAKKEPPRPVRKEISPTKRVASPAKKPDPRPVA